MERKSAFSRTLSYFETADLREASACHDEAGKVLLERAQKEGNPAEVKTRRKRRVNGEATEHETLASA